MEKVVISFIIPFSTIEKDKFLNLNEKDDLWEENDSANIIYSTIKTIKNINSLKCEKEILLVDNSHTWPEIKLPNVRVIKGWQALPLEELEKIWIKTKEEELAEITVDWDNDWKEFINSFGGN